MYIYVYIYTYIYMHCMGAPHVVTFLLISHAGHPGIAGQSAHVEQGLGSWSAHVEHPGEA